MAAPTDDDLRIEPVGDHQGLESIVRGQLEPAVVTATPLAGGDRHPLEEIGGREGGHRPHLQHSS